MNDNWPQLERKYASAGEKTVTLTDGKTIEGYASFFDIRDTGGDVVRPGAYRRSLEALEARGGSIKMLWQHDPTQPIGIWDEVREDSRGLYVKGRLLLDVERAREAAALITAGAIDGLSIGYRTVRAQRDGKGQRLLSELDLWEVSLVTFPMLPQARVGAKNDARDRIDAETLAAIVENARKRLTGR